MVFFVMVILTGFLILRKNQLSEKYIIPDKKERLQNLKIYSGVDKPNDDIIASDIEVALYEDTNWDNLFLSENFKKKYKDRNEILDDVENIVNISSGTAYEYGDNAVVIYAEKKSDINDTDESDDITTEYYFRYILDEAGEVDDLILLKKQDIYTINGEIVGSKHEDAG